MRPIFITALTLMAGAAAILNDPIFQGMAAGLLFGTGVATVLTLIVIPLGCISAGKQFYLMNGQSFPEKEVKESSDVPAISMWVKVWKKLLSVSINVFYVLREAVKNRIERFKHNDTVTEDDVTQPESVDEINKTEDKGVSDEAVSVSKKKTGSKKKATKKETESKKEDVTKEKISKKTSSKETSSKRTSKKKRRGIKLKNIEPKQEKQDDEKE